MLCGARPQVAPPYPPDGPFLHRTRSPCRRTDGRHGEAARPYRHPGAGDRRRAARHDSCCPGLAAGVAPFKAHMARSRIRPRRPLCRTSSAAQTRPRHVDGSADQSHDRLGTAMFDKEVGPPLRQLASTLEQLVAQLAEWWESWATTRRPLWSPRSAQPRSFSTSCTDDRHRLALAAQHGAWRGPSTNRLWRPQPQRSAVL